MKPNQWFDLFLCFLFPSLCLVLIEITVEHSIFGFIGWLGVAISIILLMQYMNAVRSEVQTEGKERREN